MTADIYNSRYIYNYLYTIYILRVASPHTIVNFLLVCFNNYCDLMPIYNFTHIELHRINI